MNSIFFICIYCCRLPPIPYSMAGVPHRLHASTTTTTLRSQWFCQIVWFFINSFYNQFVSLALCARTMGRGYVTLLQRWSHKAYASYASTHSINEKYWPIVSCSRLSVLIVSSIFFLCKNMRTSLVWCYLHSYYKPFSINRAGTYFTYVVWCEQRDRVLFRRDLSSWSRPITCSLSVVGLTYFILHFAHTHIQCEFIFIGMASWQRSTNDWRRDA